jgi:hypothetical protein
MSGLHEETGWTAEEEVGTESSVTHSRRLRHIPVLPRIQRLRDAVVLDKLTKRPELADVRTSVVYSHIHKKMIGPV